MEEPLTEELLNQLLSSENPEKYLDSHELPSRNLADYLQELLAERGLVRKEVIRAAHLNETYGYELFTGKKTHPGRDKVLQLAFGLGLGLRETDRLLQTAGASRLYCKDRRDAIVIFCLDRHATLDKANEALFAHGEETLG